MSSPQQRVQEAERLLHAGRFADAAAAFGALAARQPRNMSLQRAHASALTRSGKVREAKGVLRRALKIEPTNHELLFELSVAHLSEGDAEEAERVIDRALASKPGDSNVIAGKAMTLKALGRYDEAIGLIGPSIGENVANPVLVHVFLELCVHAGRTDEGIDVGRRALAQNPPAFTERRVRLELAKLLEQAGEFDEAFEHFAAVNAMKGGAAGFDADAFDALATEMIEAWTPDLLASAATGSERSELPIFIVGMPRSGSTLAEQILSRHSLVGAAGEIPDFHVALAELVTTAEPDTFDGSATPMVRDPELLTKARLDRMGRKYVRTLAKVQKGAARITDKMLTNFLHVGPIRLMLPNSRVIHATRDPIDTCLSCFCQDFNSPTPYTQDLTALGRFFNTYERVMRHWTGVVDCVHEATYEQIVTDVERQARELVSFAGLDWENACARPHEGERYARTASADQVRRPVYASSVERWKRYEKHLGPLLETLERGGSA